ncbi:MAG: archaeal cell division control protein 6 [Candidatus Diapherotrites archaeon]|nr:archaeal cell division control protein 6 [Candidatus Diapherotrites archaeon]MDN5366603.1 archaeal cell division control protein 6 [Candidatus Diapherotrites archaeon]
MGLFEEPRATILLRPEVLDTDYIPDVLPHREAQMKEIASAISYALDTGHSSNIFVVGPPGTGKTASVRYILRELSSYSPLTFQTYINCWVYRTRYSIISFLAKELRIPVPRRGVAPDEAYDRIFARLNDSRGAVIVLDEVDRLSRESTDVLYDFSRLHEFLEVPTVIITIANSESFVYRLDPRIYSTLFSRKVEFSPYTVPQLKDILRERAKIALAEGTYDENVIGLCAAIGWKRGGDARAAISCLYEAAVLAEREGADRITPEHVRRVEGLIKSSRHESVDPKFIPIVEILRERGELTVKELYEEYVRRADKITLRAFRNYIKELESLGVVETRRLNVRGYVRAVRLRE